MEINITTFWKLFCYGIKRNHYDKLIGIKEFLKQLAQGCFNNNFSPDRGNPSNNIPPPLTRLMMEIQFLLAVHFISLVVFLPPQRSALFPTWISTVPQLYLLDLSIFPRKKKLNREGDITVLLEVTVRGSCLMEIDASGEAFGFARGVIGSTRRCTIVDKLVVIVFKCIMTTSFVSLDMFHVWFVHNNDDFLG